MWDYIFFVAKLSLLGAFLCGVAAVAVEAVKMMRKK